MAASIYSDFLTEHFPPHSSALQSSDIALLSTYLAGGNEGGDEAIALLKQLRESAVSPRAKDRGLARLYVDALPILAEEYPDIHGKLIALFEALSLHRDASEHPDGLSWALRSLYDGERHPAGPLSLPVGTNC